MKIENWIQTICAGIGLIIIILIFLLTITFNMKGRIGYFESMPPRIDDIVEALREKGVVLIREELISPFEIAVIATDPTEISPGNWISDLHIIDAKRQQRISYEIKHDRKDDKVFKNLVTGIAHRSDESALSFLRLADFSKETEKIVMLPMELDGKSSFILHKAPEGFTTEFDIFKVTPKVNSLSLETYTWDNLIKEIKKNIDDYFIKRPIKKK